MIKKYKVWCIHGINNTTRYFDKWSEVLAYCKALKCLSTVSKYDNTTKQYVVVEK